MTSVRLKEGVFSKGDDSRSSTTSAFIHFDPVIANLDYSMEQMSTHFHSGETSLGACDIKNESEVVSKQQNVWLRALQSKVCKCIDTTFTALVIILVWMVMALPTIIYINTLVRPYI